jgi:(E)-4-hydroxy-3-methylbut-2-enyl-diphosphate synthase
MKTSFDRRKTRPVYVGKVGIGGDNPISIQSMTNTDTHDIDATYDQVMRLAEVGCDIVRITAPDLKSVNTFASLISRGVDVPLVADIHFNHEIAIAAAQSGVSKIRINPGNIGDDDKVLKVVEACKSASVPIRIGVNSGSLEKHILAKYTSPTPEALAESALYHAALLEKFDFSDIVISVKASNVPDMIKANRILAKKTMYPLHLGVTEAGGGNSAIVKSSIGIGTLLTEGIGDTVRVSLTDDPVKEIYAAKEILRAVGMAKEPGLDIVACPTCGRTKINLIGLLGEFKDRVRKEGLDNLNIKVALMGCVVNGPGEAREADLGIAGGNGEGLLFKKGEIIRKVDEARLIDELIAEIKNTYCK